MFRRSLSLAAATLLAGTLLAGCGGPQAPSMTAAQVAAKKIGAKSLTMRDIDAIVTAAAGDYAPIVNGGIPAVLKAPSDVVAQRGLQVLYGSVIDQALPEIDWQIDEEVNVSIIGAERRKYPEVSKPEVAAYIQGIADRLCKAAKVSPFKVYVLDVPMVNAFNAGGHAMVLFTPLILEAKDEAELAGVMAHEMAHGLARHMLKGYIAGLSGATAAGKVAQLHPMPEGEPEMAQSYMLTLPLWQQQDQDFVLGHLQGKIGAETQKNLEFALNDTFAQSAMGRNMEAEADKLGTRMLAAAGYDPYGLSRTFERWNDRADGDTRYYSHPALGSRSGSVKGQIVKEGLKGDDRGLDRHAAIVKLLTPPAPAQGVVQVPAIAAGSGCFHGEALQPVRKLKR